MSVYRLAVKIDDLKWFLKRHSAVYLDCLSGAVAIIKNALQQIKLKENEEEEGKRVVHFSTVSVFQVNQHEFNQPNGNSDFDNYASE